jgi:hypothetical protein
LLAAMTAASLPFPAADQRDGPIFDPSADHPREQPVRHRRRLHLSLASQG